MRYKYEKDMLPDIILVDVYMPGFDGWDFLEQLKLFYPTLNKRIEVYILSAFKYPEDVQRAAKYSFVKAYILKPITKEVLLRLIEHKKMSLNNFEAIAN
jgi:YesN/AraC family two-component response regulator